MSKIQFNFLKFISALLASLIYCVSPIARASGCGVWSSQEVTPQAEQAAEKVLFVIPSEARDLLLFAKPKKKQIPRANPALRNDSLRVFPQPLERAKG
jgi:hypothetical protein